MCRVISSELINSSAHSPPPVPPHTVFLIRSEFALIAKAARKGRMPNSNASHSISHGRRVEDGVGAGLGCGVCWEEEGWRMK